MPFGPYEDFDDCVAKNRDVEDPEAYCAMIEKQILGPSTSTTGGARLTSMRLQIVPVIDDIKETTLTELGQISVEVEVEIGKGEKGPEMEDEMPPQEEVLSDVEEEEDLMESEDFHTMMVLEGVWTGDGRYIEEGALGWRDLPLPLMATDRTTEGHMNAVLIGRLTRIERMGREIHAYGSYVETEDPTAMSLQNLVRKGELRGVSVDLDSLEYEVIVPSEAPTETVNPATGEVAVSIDDLKMRVTSARVMGCTVVPFPAFQEAFIENMAALTASIIVRPELTGWISAISSSEDSDRGSIVASGHPIEAPVVPPSSWFLDPQLVQPTPLTVDDSGRVYGHLAVWGQCHVGFGDRCIQPPSSPAQYAHFLTGEILCEDGSRFPVGQITMNSGHAPQHSSASQTAAHYDNTAMAAADVTAGEDDFGIWVSGALRPGLDASNVRALMASDVSGDWRRIGGSLELVAILAVNVPGFPKIRVKEALGLVASLSLPAYEGETAEKDDLLARAVNRIANSIGRSQNDRIAEITRRVKGDK